MQSFTRLLRFGALVSWIIVVMNEFRVFRPVRDAAWPSSPRAQVREDLADTRRRACCLLFSVWLQSGRKDREADPAGRVLPRMSLPARVASSISSLTYYAMVIFGLLVALAAAGFEMSQFAIVIGALGVGIASACRTS